MCVCVIEYPIQSWNIQNCFDKCVRTLDKQCYAMHVQSLWFWGFGYLLPISSSSKLRFGDAAGNIWWLLLFKEGGASRRTFEESSSSLLSCKSPTIVSMMIAHLAEATILPTNDKLYPLTLTLSQKCFFKSKITLQQTHQPLDGV